jgi:hypothetical protein
MGPAQGHGPIAARLKPIEMAIRNRIPSQSARLVFIMVALIWAVPAGAQDLGHKVLGTLGLLAGSQPSSGLYVVDRLLSYGANDIFDRDGHRIPVGLDLDAVANGIGAQVTLKLPRLSTYMNVSVGVPASHIHLQTDRPEATLDRFGFGDLYVQPIKIGWKMTQVDIVSGYAFYAPTGRFTPRGSDGVGRGHWTHEFSLGSAVYFDRAKTWHVSGLASYELNQRNRGIDIRRGDTIQFQGGAGKTLRNVDVGLATYALRQVRDDRGADVPEPLLGARDRVFGLGPEIDITLAPIRSRITVRYCRDVVVKARPLGQVLVFGLTIMATR